MTAWYWVKAKAWKVRTWPRRRRARRHLADLMAAPETEHERAMREVLETGETTVGDATISWKDELMETPRQQEDPNLDPPKRQHATETSYRCIIYWGSYGHGDDCRGCSDVLSHLRRVMVEQLEAPPLPFPLPWTPDPVPGYDKRTEGG